MNALLHASWLPILGWTLLHSLWEGVLVALIAALALRSLRGATPRLRYVVAVLGLLLMVGLPLRHLVPTRSASTVIFLEQGGLTSVGSAPASVSSTPLPLLRTRMKTGLERALPWVVLAWALGTLLSFLRLAGGWVLLQRLRWRLSELAPDALQRQLLDLCRRAGLKRAVTLLMCEGLAGPSVVGILRPAILVPAGWFLNLPPDHVEALLAHELAHVLRHDYAVNLLQSLVEVVLFYHPGVWWLSRRIRTERELACDTFAVRLMGDSLPLAEALTHLERRGLGRAPLEPAPAPAAHGGSLMERISHLLLPTRRTSSAPAFGAMAVVASLLVSGLHLAAQAPDPTPVVPPVIPQDTVREGYPRAILYMRSKNAKDADDKDLPYTHLLDIKANQVPLNQVWKSVEAAASDKRPDVRGQMWARRDERIHGPLVNLDMNSATPAEVLAVLNRLAKEHGVEPYQAPDPREPGPFTLTKYTLKDGREVLNLHARQVSPAYLETLMQAARKLPAGCGSGFHRDSDTYPGPKVDAIFECLSLEELEARIHKLQAEAK